MPEPTIRPQLSPQYRQEDYDLAGDIAAAGPANVDLHVGGPRPLTHRMNHDLGAHTNRVLVTTRRSNINPAMAGEDAATPGATAEVTVNDPESDPSIAEPVRPRAILPLLLGIGIGVAVAAAANSARRS